MIHPKKENTSWKKPMESRTECGMWTKAGCLNRVVNRRTHGWWQQSNIWQTARFCAKNITVSWRLM